MHHLLLLLLIAALAPSAEPPPVPDPFGLGERLALIDHLQTKYQRAVPPGTDIATLRTWHAEELRRAQTQQDPWLTDELQRLRSRLHLSYGIDASENGDRTALVVLLKEAESRQEQTNETRLVDLREASQRSVIVGGLPRFRDALGVAENGDIRGADNDGDGRKESVYVKGHYRKGVYVRAHYRASPRR